MSGAATRPRLAPGAVVVVHLVEPAEKYWGLLEELSAAGVVVRGLNLSSFEDWMVTIADGEQPAIEASTVFFPLRRVERLFLDEPQGMAESLCDRFARRVGRPVTDVLGA